MKVTIYFLVVVLTVLSSAVCANAFNAELALNKLSSNSAQDFIQHVSSIKSILKTPLSALSQDLVLPHSGFQTQSVSTACSSAWSTLVVANNKCLQAMVADMATLENAAPHADRLCNATLPVNCAEIAVSVSTIQTTCTSSELAENLAQGGATYLWKNATGFALLCTKDNSNNYCLSEIDSLQSSFANPSQITNATLSQICGSPCISKMFKMAVASGAVESSQASSMNVLCAKDTTTNEYCYPKVIGSMMSSGVPDMTAIANVYCSPCLRKMMAAMNASSFVPAASINMMDKIIPSLCVSDGQQYCLATMPNMMTSFSSLASAGDNICPALRTILANQTCCFGSLLNAFNDIQSLTDGESSDNQVDLPAMLVQVSNQCQATVPAACSVSKVVDASLKFPTLKYSYYVANKNSVETAVKKDVASFAGVSVDKVAIKSVTELAATSSTWNIMAKFVSQVASSSGVQFNVAITPDSDAQATTLSTNLQSAIQSSSLDLTNVNTLPSDSKSSTLPVTASTTSSTTVGDNTSSGSSGSNSAVNVAPSSIIMIALAAFSLLVKF